MELSRVDVEPTKVLTAPKKASTRQGKLTGENSIAAQSITS